MVPIFDFALLRYNTNGSLDNSFSSDGQVTLDIGSTNQQIYAVAVQGDGKIVAAGYSGDGSIAVLRYNTDGSPDNSFSADGIAITTIIHTISVAFCLAIQGDGKIVVAGSSFNGNYTDIAVLRYNINGSLDNTFSADGIVITAIGSFGEVAYSVAIQKDSKIVVAGFSSNGNYEDIAVVRYNTNGSLDNTFSSMEN